LIAFSALAKMLDGLAGLESEDAAAAAAAAAVAVDAAGDVEVAEEEYAYDVESAGIVEELWEEDSGWDALEDHRWVGLAYMQTHFEEAVV
jgi:hypothetical protein